MKTLLGILFLFLPFVCFAQEQPIDPKIEIKNEIWGSSDPDFKTTQAYEKWDKESAVILCKKYDYRVQKEFLSSVATERIYTRTRVLLRDKAAVNDFSTMSFDISKDLGGYFGWGNQKDVFIGVKIIKSNGSEKEIPIDPSLIDEIKSRRSVKQIQKIAIPDLEVGDIIDYYKAVSNEYYAQNYFPFSPVIYPLVEKYPVMKQKIEMHVMRRCYLNARSMNGAPEFKLQEDSKRKDMVYTITDLDRDKVKDQVWLYEFRDLPVVIFQAYFIGNATVKNLYCFYDQEDVIKKSVSDDELASYIRNNWHPSGKAIRKAVKHIKNTSGLDQDPVKTAREAYYFYRQFIYAQYYKRDMARGYYKNRPLYDNEFVNNMSDILMQSKVPVYAVYTVPRELGTLDDLIIPNQLQEAVRINSANPVYISKFSRYSLFDELDESVQGTSGKQMRIITDEINKLQNTTFPVDSFIKNSTIAESNVSFEPDSEDVLQIEKNVSVGGLEKQKYQYWMIAPDEYLAENTGEHYGVKTVTDEDEMTNKKFFQVVSDFKKGREKNLLELLKATYKVTDLKIKDFKMLQTGMWENEPLFKYSVSFSLKKYITKIDSNFLLDAGRLLENTFETEEIDSVRQYNIYLSYAHSYNQILNIRIPKGYKIKSNDNFTIHCSNTSGSFSSNAQEQGTIYSIRLSRNFYQNYYPKSKWQELRNIINANTDFTNQQLLIVPDK